MTHHRSKHLRVAITGGTSGLGLALVRALHAGGAKVAFVARDAQRVASTAAGLPGTPRHRRRRVAQGRDAPASRCRSTPHSAGSTCWSTTPRRSGPCRCALLADTDCEDLEAALATNLVGPFRLSKALLGALAASAREGRPARIVNITSDAAVTPYAQLGRATARARPALLHLSRIWDEELREHGVAVIAVDPGDMDTPLHAAARARCRPRNAEAAGRRRARDPRARSRRSLRERAGVQRMKAASRPVQRPRDARLLVIDEAGHLQFAPRSRLVGLSAARRPGGRQRRCHAARQPAQAAHVRSGMPIEVRLAARTLAARGRRAAVHAPSCSAPAITAPAPKTGPRRHACASAMCSRSAAARHRRAHARSPAADRAALSRPRRRHLGRHRAARQTDPVRAHRRSARAVGRVDDVAALPVAFEPPSAGFVLDWEPAARAARARHRFRHAHPCRGHLVDRRRRRSTRACRSTSPITCRSPRCERSRPRARAGGRIVAVGTTVTARSNTRRPRWRHAHVQTTAWPTSAIGASTVAR